MSYKYNPGFLSDYDSIESFVVRHRDLCTVCEVLRNNSDAPTNRHVLVIGPRGSGKSTLARRVVAELRTDTTLVNLWHPIVLGEESYTITSAGEFWLEAVFHLAEQLGRSDIGVRYKEIQAEKDNSRLREFALDTLVSFSREVRKRLLLVVENFDMIVEDQLDDEERWALRSVFQNVPELMLFATATKRFSQLEHPDKALFEQFAFHELRPLPLTEVHALWASLTQEDVIPRKVRPIQILTGGSPRLIAILADFAVSHSLSNLMLRLTSLIDQYTDYFKSQLDSLPTAERKVFVSVLEKWDPATTREIAQDARMSVNITSSHLNRLRIRGAVQKRFSHGTQYWEASERLFNLYYLMRRRGASSNRVDALVKFMTVYYEGDQLYERATDLAKECSALHPTLRQDHYSVLARIIPELDDSKRATLLNLTPPDFAQTLSSVGLEPTPTIKKRRGPKEVAREKIMALVDDRKIGEAVDALRNGRFTEARYAGLWAYVALGMWREEKDTKGAHSLLKRAIELNDESGRFSFLRALLFKQEREHTDAIRALETAIERGQAKEPEVWVALGDACAELPDLRRAEHSYRTAIAIDPTLASAWFALGELLSDRNLNLTEAEVAMRKAVELKPDEVAYRGALATFLLHKRYAPKEARDLAEGILQGEPTDGRAWGLLIRAMSLTNSIRKIEAEYDRAINTPSLRYAWRVHSAYAGYLNSIHAHDRAEQVLKEAAKSNPENEYVWLDLANHLFTYGERNDDVFEVFQKALELAPNNSQVWEQFGEFLSNLDERRSEAERALRQATKLAPTDCSAWRALGAHLAKSGKDGEASECFLQAIRVNPGCNCSMDAYAKLLVAQSEGIDRIREIITGFMDKAPDSPGPHVVLAEQLLSNAHDHEGAIKHVLIALKKGYPVALSARHFARALHVRNEELAIRHIEQFLADAPAHSDARNLLAWNLYERQVAGGLQSYALQIAREAVDGAPESWSARHTLAALLFAAGESDSAFNEIRWLADHVDERSLSDFIDLCVVIARKAKGPLRNTLCNSNTRSLFEPLLTALDILEGKEPNVAREILEVAHDICEQVRQGEDGASKKAHAH